MVSCTALAEGATCQPSASSSASVAVSIASISGTMKSGRCFSTAARSAAAVEHREDFGRVGALHRRRIGIAVAGDHPAAEPLGGDGEFAAELARTEQHQSGKIHGGRDLTGLSAGAIPAMVAHSRICRRGLIMRRTLLLIFLPLSRSSGAAPPAKPLTPSEIVKAAPRVGVADDRPRRLDGDRPQERRAGGRPARAPVRAGPCRQHPGAGARRLVDRRRGLSRPGQLCRAMGQ